MGLADGGGEDFGVGLFQEIAGSSDGFGMLDVGILGVGRKNEDFGVGRVLEDLSGGFQAVDQGHGNVHDHNIRTIFAGEGDGLATVLGFADDLDIGLGFQENFEAFPDVGMIFGKEDSDRFHNKLVRGEFDAKGGGTAGGGVDGESPGNL